MVNNSFAQFIEELRISRNMNREDFLDGIISKRQYQRFLNGESSIKNDVMTKLLERIELNSIDLYYQYLTLKGLHSKEILDVHELVTNFEFNKAYNKLQQVNFNSIKNDYDKKFFTYLDTLVKIKLNKIPKSTGNEKLIDLVNYPEVLNSTVLNFLEINTLVFISDYLILEKKDFKVPNYLFNLFRDKPAFFNMTNPYYKPVLYSNVSRSLGIIEEFEKSVQVANWGIEQCRKYQIYSGLNSLLYYKALGEEELYDDDRSKKTIVRLLHSLEVFNLPSKETYYNAIQKNFNLTVDEISNFLNIKKEV
jgi:transcriptional regulator with XRE-family HTH domain